MRTESGKGVSRRLHSLLGWPQVQSASDHFRERSLIALTVLTALPAWLWLGYNLQCQRIDPLGGIALMVTIVGACWLVHRLHRTHYLWAVCAFLATQMLFITSMLWLLRDLTIGYLFVIVTATATLAGPVSAIITTAIAIAIEVTLISLTQGAIGQAWTLTRQIFLHPFVASVSLLATSGLYEALDSAELSAQEASKRAEEARWHRAELHRTLKSLDLAWAQLQRANSELFYAREAADAALRFKSEFAAQISHELRTSLNLVLGFSETMAFSQDAYGVRLPAPYLRDVMEIHRNSRHLLALIDDVLDLSKLEAGRMGLRREPVDLGSMLCEAADIARPLVERKGLELVLELPQTLPMLMLDRTRIRQVVLNLLSNAVRATAHGRIVVTARSDGSQVIVHVSDTGIGISAEDLVRVFEEFYQSDGAAGSTGAAGLGLAVSKRIVMLHGGRMWAESEVGVGSTFSGTDGLEASPLPVAHGALLRLPACLLHFVLVLPGVALVVLGPVTVCHLVGPVGVLGEGRAGLLQAA